jgi:hypothetical protein
VGQDTICKPATFIWCAIYPLIFSAALNELIMLVTFSCDGVDDGVRGVQLDGSVGNIRGEYCIGMVYDDVGIMWTVVCWEALSLFESA